MPRRRNICLVWLQKMAFCRRSYVKPPANLGLRALSITITSERLTNGQKRNATHQIAASLLFLLPSVLLANDDP
jgi:hypothetical protein